MEEEITFFSKKDTECPVCRTMFKREELMTGRGRLSAGDLTNELRRNYVPTKKYGVIYPLIYPMTVCPSCLFAADDFDFMSFPAKNIDLANSYKDVRARYLINVFGKVPDFHVKRDLVTGISSYILSMSCYPLFDKKRFSPTVKVGLYSLRTAWLLADLFNETNEQKYQELLEQFYLKASEFYDRALENQSKAIESLDGAKNLGPDTDKNYGYDGVLYINAILKYRNSYKIEDPLEKLKLFQEIKRTVSKVFGMGKKAKNKPEILLSFAREIYDKLAADIEGLEASLGKLGGDEEPAEEEEEEEEESEN